jgi:2-dehydro-3-deoxy-D-gluconate 5-dehydrogenase
VSPHSLFDLSGRTALVTGCRRGIGKAIAVALAEAGADIVGVSANLTPGSDVQHAVESTGRMFAPFTCDFTDRPALYSFISDVRQQHPRVDILVNNAGTILRRPAAEHPDSDWDTVLEANATSGFILAREFGRDMLARNDGKIVFIASVLAFQGGINVPGYAASKGAVIQVVKALSNEWAGRGVNVNAVAPGYIETDNTAPLRSDPDRSTAILSRIPAGRWGRPEDIAGAVLYLASHAAGYVHGTVLTVDGGWLGR